MPLDSPIHNLRGIPRFNAAETCSKWPDGTIEQGHKFKASLEAQNWVKTQSAEWLAERLAVPAP